MKKLLIYSLLLLSVTMFSQETFVKKYTSYVTKEKGVFTPWVKSEITVVFNANGVKDIVFYYPNESTRTLHQITSLKRGSTVNGEGYQVIDCIDEDGVQVGVQLFDDDTCLRILIAKGYTVEFHND